MQETIKVKETKRSETNPRPEADFSGAAFDELVASVKEKGVLMPILVRPLSSNSKGGKYEVVAGNRRLAAAKEAGLEEVPARVVKMTDREAAEAQIIENLQRKDVHPLEEGAAYKALIESAKPKLDVAEVAAKVGKSLTYVRGRLLLTNLDDKIAKRVRSGDVPLTNAIELARLSKPAQTQLVNYLRRSVYGAEACDLKTLRKLIAEQTFSQLRAAPPWKDDEAMKAEIARVTGIKDEAGVQTLFGEKGLAKIENPADYAAALAAYIELTKRKYAADGKPLTLVSDNYSTNAKGLIGKSSYETDRVKGCKDLHDALIVEGDGLGKIVRICTNKACKPHHPYQYQRADTPVEEAKRKAQRKAQIADEKKKKDTEAKLMGKAVAKMTCPIPAKQIDALLSLAIKRAHYDTLRAVAKRRELSGKRYDDAVKTAAKEMKPADKAGLLLEVMVPSWSIGPDLARIIKGL